MESDINVILEITNRSYHVVITPEGGPLFDIRLEIVTAFLRYSFFVNRINIMHIF